MDYYLYLPPGGDKMTKHAVDTIPPVPPHCTRFVCISDTHNEHRQLKLPWGHVLVHSGDMLTASGTRYVKRTDKGTITHVDPLGPKLVKNFAQWLGKLPHPHKVVIGGNHDLVLEAMGTDTVKHLIASESGGRAIYLCHENASVGRLKVFGSPHAHWGGTNDAFFKRNTDYSKMENGTHLMLTHMPAILPQREDRAMVMALERAGASLHVSGHCHWAHGLYKTKNSGVPCVVASVCEAKWRKFKELNSGPGGERGDNFGDSIKGWGGGGYNLFFPAIVCDILVPGGPPSGKDVWKGEGALPELHTPKESNGKVVEEKQQTGTEKPEPKPNLLFFGATTDPGAVQRLVPLLQDKWNVHLFKSATEAIRAIKESGTNFACAVAKLGSTNNKGWDVLKAIKPGTPVIVHSATACRNEGTRRNLCKDFGPQIFICDHSSEGAMLNALEQLTVCR